MSEEKEQKEQKEQGEEKQEKKRFWTQFKEFITKGSVIDLAVGVIIGNAFKAIVTALTEKVIMPAVTYLLGDKSVADFKTVLKKAELNDAGEVVKAESAIYWGEFIQALLDFFIIALVLFVIVKAAMAFHEKRLELAAKLAKKNGAEGEAEEEAESDEEAKAEEEAESDEEAGEEPSIEEQNAAVLKEIRDLLKEKRE